MDNGIPLEIWDTQPVMEARRAATEKRADAASGAPSTVGVNLDVLQPAVFAPSVLPRLGVDMPRVASGTYATGTVSTSLTTGSHAKGSDAMASAAAFTVGTATPKRISARLSIRIEDVAAVGQANFESVLRENISLSLADELDDQALKGAGGNSGADLLGYFNRLTDPAAPAAAVATFDAFVAAFAGGIDGLWSATMSDVSIVCGVETYRLSATTFRDIAAADLGDTSFADYAMQRFGGWWTNKRMPAAASDVQQAILYRSGRTTSPTVMRTAVCPHWGTLTIDDIYSGSASGTRFFTAHVLLGDVLIVQPDSDRRKPPCLGGSLGEVGGDCQRIGGQGGVSVQRRPFGPPAPCRPILRASVGGAAVAECPIDARPVGCAQFDRQGNGERCHGVDAGSCPASYHHL